jgi:hypothetical protein
VVKKKEQGLNQLSDLMDRLSVMMEVFRTGLG